MVFNPVNVDVYNSLDRYYLLSALTAAAMRIYLMLSMLPFFVWCDRLSSFVHLRSPCCGWYKQQPQSATTILVGLLVITPLSW
ncbi:PI-PLC X domain-containing protein 1 [Fusarium oxysporum f. sp. albedinis]|nr:PI-PLC X domain-containing protein 1 [Fusarium oxysporum f. sp. albedinis]